MDVDVHGDAVILAALLVACGPDATVDPRDTGGDPARDSGAVDSASDSPDDSASDTGDSAVPVVEYDPWPFIDAAQAYVPGEAAGFGQDRFPDVVFGPPMAPGDGGGSLDVLSLGREGSIAVSFRELDLVDGPGPDLLVFENPFTGWYETGVVGVSMDGATWTEWPCAADDADVGYPGCAGVALVYANATNGVDATDPDAAGGDRFDLADIGVTRARYVRVRDSGANDYGGIAGGFDLDAMSALNTAPRDAE